ncbi:flavin reductase family protein [Paenibacillus prosopidis]|uniref:Flavin reductase (DIM6/NTAB) family NADH-FMN oxidoreductase RutF n=1 Tax=Paenibacillus prosopidis TaxID=630520 RepID=A0A368VJ49_9BACL|nr:flavin reductase family protein [Paenibacillus prosopidis]RCW41535.1 flavin reductase (DIM6/NTAB) family NADH-FMN oxidoreductase RutF [Paenibacillus prosopidis]
MISIDPTSQSVQDNYKLLIGSIVPRPIAFVSTLSSEGVLNAAPFSFFNIVTANPPMVAISVQRKQGDQKDTARNAVEAGEFVVHIADEDYIEAINITAANLPPDESEVALAGLTAIPSERVSVPGIAEAKIRMECVLEQALPLGGTEESPACDLLIGRVVRFHVAESLYGNGRINAEALRPVSRLAGSDYAKLGEQFSIDRPG